MFLVSVSMMPKLQSLASPTVEWLWMRQLSNSPSVRESPCSSSKARASKQRAFSRKISPSTNSGSVVLTKSSLTSSAEPSPPGASHSNFSINMESNTSRDYFSTGPQEQVKRLLRANLQRCSRPGPPKS